MKYMSLDIPHSGKSKCTWFSPWWIKPNTTHCGNQGQVIEGKMRSNLWTWMKPHSNWRVVNDRFPIITTNYHQLFHLKLWQKHCQKTIKKKIWNWLKLFRKFLYTVVHCNTEVTNQQHISLFDYMPIWMVGVLCNLIILWLTLYTRKLC